MKSQILNHRSLVLRMSGILCSAILAGALLTSTPATAQTIIYADDFSGSAATNLNGLAPDVRSGTDGGSSSATWTADTIGFKANGSVTGQTGNTRYAYLPFTPDTGKVYTLTVDLDPVDTTSGNWLAAGFTSSPTTSSSSFSANAPWVIYRQNGSGNAFESSTTSFDSGAAFGTAGSVSDPITLTLTLNTTTTLWTATYSAFDLTTATSLGSGSTTYASNPSITGVFLGSLATSGTVDNFQLSVTAVPEPSAFALLGIVLLAISWRARARRMRVG